MRHCWRSKEELISDVLQWTPIHGHTSVSWATRTYISSVQTLDVIWRICLEGRMIGTDGEWELGKSVLLVGLDDDNDVSLFLIAAQNYISLSWFMSCFKKKAILFPFLSFLYLDYHHHLYCYIHYILAAVSFNLFQMFHVKLRCPYRTSN